MSRALPAWFKGFLARYRRAVATAIGLGLLASGCAALLMFTSGYLISATAVVGTTLFSIMVPVACVQLFGIGRPLARYAERLASHDWVLHVTSDLRLSLYRAIERRTGDPARERATGEYLGLLSDDVAHLQNLYLRVVFPTAIAYLLAIGAAVLFGFFSVPFALVMLLSFATVAVLMPFGCLLATSAGTERAKSIRAAEYVALSDDVSGAIDWVLADRGDEACERHGRADALIRAVEARGRLVRRAFSLAVTVLLAAVICGVIVWAGDSFGSGAAANANWIAAFALGFFPLIESFVALPAAFAESTTHRDSLARLDEHLDESLVAADAPSASHADESAWRAGPRGFPEAPKGEDERDAQSECRDNAVELVNVSYTYPGTSKRTLADVLLSVRAGETIAVLGRSGAGKSTLAKLVCGSLVPDDGWIDVNEGSAFGAEERPPLPVGFVGQVPYLFNRTLRENLTVGTLEADDGRLVEVLESVGLGEKFAALDEGLDTVVGETGVGFSGGEAHRIAIARVLVASAPVVVVDEPFAALDPDTERELLDALLSACSGRTLIVVTHHLAQVDRFDRVVFVESGCIGLDGSPSELRESSARFRELLAFDR